VIPIAGQLEISRDTTIDGGGVVTLDGQGLTRLIQVNAGAAVELRGLTLTNGFTDTTDGGAILNNGTLAIESSTLIGNSSEGLGGAVYSSGVLTINASALTGNIALGGAWAGAIYNNGGVVTITNSTLRVNRAEAFGGAIFNFDNGILTIIASTLSDNSANFGGAIFNNPNTAVTIIASTLSDNRANFGGAIYNAGGLTVMSSTLAGNSSNNGGTIYTFSSLGGFASLTGNILSGSGLCVGPIISTGYNVADDDTCNLTAAGDLQNANPLLGNLANNGGPTQTFMPQAGSPAIDRVPNAACVALAATNNNQDQRGAPRPESNGLPCDSGSVELQVNNYFCVGDRSGTLRYFVTPNGCVRGEHRLMQSADGLYAVCVGDRSGSMRYLPTSGASCQRGEWMLVLPEDGPITVCVGERSRTVRYVANAGQCNARGELVYVIINPAG
jgi:predicted outer membrane repeat protein